MNTISIDIIRVSKDMCFLLRKYHYKKDDHIYQDSNVIISSSISEFKNLIAIND